ncbi:MAG: Pyridoxal phosphate homeostasis protein [Eubacteriales bacterium SKADARSKE-1]|nr:Pyridoxal phosphate homeostasis protein [Eubacteriales bacterium SKADARSKE-1]
MMERLSSEIDKKLSERLNLVNYNIEVAARKSGRNFADITLVCATKTVDTDIINRVIDFGVKNIGENRVQELLRKYDGINKETCNIHFIGHLQTNKVKDIVGKVRMIQSVDSLGLANMMSKFSQKKDVLTDVLIEVNIGNDKNKFGILTKGLQELIYNISKLKNIKVRGLMTIPPISKKPDDARFYFNNMYNLFIDIANKKIDNVSMDFLSMGMSQDYVSAIECGANMIRLGECIFGKRD